MVKQNSTAHKIGQLVVKNTPLADIYKRLGATENSVSNASRDYRDMGNSLLEAADKESDKSKAENLRKSGNGAIALADKIKGLLPVKTGAGRGRKSSPELSITDILSMVEGMEDEAEDEAEAPVAQGKRKSA